MKAKILIIIFSMLWFSGLTAQTDSAKNDTLKIQIENYLSENNYTRIPNKDFEKILQNTIEEEVKNSLTYWLTLISVIIAVFGGVATYAFNIKIKQVVQEQLEAKNKEILSNLDKMMLESKMNKFRMDFEVLKEKYELNPKKDSHKSDAQSLLHEVINIEFHDLVPEVVNHVGLILYSKRNVEEYEDLLNKYGDDYKLKAITYMNAAIQNVDFYDIEGIKKYKENCIKYCLKAMELTPWYGEPRGILILLNAIDFVKSEDILEKKNAKAQIKIIISDILKGTSNYIASNTCKRLDRDKKDKAFNKYLSAIEKEMEDEFEKLYTKAMLERDRKDLKSNQK